MEQGPLLPQQMPMHDYTMSDHDFNGQFAGNGHHTSYAVGGAMDGRGHSAVLPQPATNTYAYASGNPPHGTRFVPDRADASRATGHFTDSSSGSISTSPSSAASYTAFPANHYTAIPPTLGPVQLPPSFVPSFNAGTRLSSFPASCMLPPPVQAATRSDPPASSTDREAYATTASYATRPPPTVSSGSRNVGFSTYPDTPRILTGATSPTYTGYGSYIPPMASSAGCPPTNESHQFPWTDRQYLATMTCEGQEVTPNIFARVEKGFFKAPSDQKWTCYRRNYFSVTCHFELHPTINNARLFLKRESSADQMIQALGMRLSASVDGAAGKSIELVQHTPKRDSGPKCKIEVTKVHPTPPSSTRNDSVAGHVVYNMPHPNVHAPNSAPGPYLPLQATGDVGSAQPGTSSQSAYPYAASPLMPGHNTAHTFERVQFKQATANNGKRRASQQYFHLIAELLADVRKDGDEMPVWVKVAHLVSEKIVVRGRSPSHYHNEGQSGQPGRSGASGGSFSNPSGVSYTAVGSSGFRGSTGTFNGAMGGAGDYRSHYNVEHGSDGSDGSDSSPISPDEIVHSPDTDRCGPEGYQYFHAPAYDAVPSQPFKNDRYSSTDPRQYSVKAEYTDDMMGRAWQMGGCNRLTGAEASRKYFMDLMAGYS
ncbi:p53-like transcription factor [Piedraia hortae CBS 480.64]|uniref:p53-like transcription factor n=1 Tax=Piedraia hortae CBS 480.64 TaxID=1314780 RepID=A0A6A7CAC8_9PEZI|nr:p53-like transcription factor [Piedraia hortae CBS 480.64]